MLKLPRLMVHPMEYVEEPSLLDSHQGPISNFQENT
jgi:hypothetical protein